MEPMSERVYEFVCDYIAAHRRSPSLREIGRACNCSHTAIIRHLDRLEGLGWIEREPGQARSIILGERGPRSPSVERPAHPP